MPRDEIDAGWRLRHDGWELQSPAGRSVFLSAAERLLMQALAAQPGTPLSRLALCAAMESGHRRGPCPHTTRRVDMLVSRLRAKARQTGAELPLVSVPREGYALTVCRT